jgi:hypothetical protein
MRVFKYATILVVLSVFLVPQALAADLSADYLHGRWVIDDQDCSAGGQSTQNPNRLRSAARHNKLRAGGSGCETNGPAKARSIGQAGCRRLHHAAGVQGQKKGYFG